MKKIKAYAKTTLCIAMSAAMLFMDMGTPVFAAEDTQQEETEQAQEIQDEEFIEYDSTELDETETATVQTTAEEERTEEIKTEEMTPEEVFTEELSIEEAETETEVEESVQNLASSGADIAHGEYKENGSNLTWVIDKNGKLTVEGIGDFAEIQYKPWHENAKDIKSAVIKVTGLGNARNMFADCENLKSVDFSGWHMSSVTDMREMFFGCEKLTSLDFSGCDMSNVKNMSNMFEHCTSLISVDFKGFNTNRVTDMSEMFLDCFNLKSVNFSSFNTRNVTDMKCMFFNCHSLTSLDLSGFDTSNVYDMQYMFCGCYKLTSLDLSSFNTSRVREGTGLVETDRAYALTKIYTPRNLNVSVALDGDWYDVNGNTYTELPKGRADSILLCKNTKPQSVIAYITAQKTKTVYVCGETLDINDITVTYYGADATIKKLAQTEYTTNVSQISMETPGEKTLTVTYKPSGGETLTADIPIIVKSTVKISGIEIKNRAYDKRPVSYTGTAKVESDGTDVTGTVKLNYTYSGTQADGSAYSNTKKAPVNAGNYKLTVSVSEDNDDYTGSVEYSFTITKAPLIVTACDLGLKTGASLPQEKDYKYGTTGLLEGDNLITEPKITCNVVNTTTAGTYIITVSGADAGMNYTITYQNGTLTVNENGETAEYYTVTFSLSGHGSNITNTGIKGGSLLKKPQDPLAKGYTFTGWYKDPICTHLWDFDNDTLEADTIIYAGWTANDTDDDDDWKDKDDSSYSYSKRTDLESVATIADIKAKVYDGDAYEPVVKVTATIDGKKTTLTEGADYRVLYQNNTDAGEGKVIVKGNGIYKGRIDKPFTITKKPVKKLKILTGDVLENANLSTFPIYVYDGTKRLQQGKDYTLSNQKSTKPGVVQVDVTGVNNYDGVVIAKFNQQENGTQLITAENVKLDKTIVAYTGKAVKPEVTVTVNGGTLTNKDYKVQYQNNKDAGTAY
ncbi:MAG: BspA family leucine-rich repeat surface protein, partial [Lachnospiraceae bacterium]|nr:BspA family leucine-rich repeat surface protein [Lachnospiraceae bacterium]